MDVQQALDINDISPTSLSHLIGQQHVVEQVKVAVQAARHDHKTFADALLVGGPGLGKTQVAKVIATEIGGSFHEILGQAIQSQAEFNALLLEAKNRDVVLIDEAQELQRRYQTALYCALDHHQLFLQEKGSGKKLDAIPIADFSLLLATTDEFKLLQPLRDRMSLTLRFEFYGVEDLVEILRQRIHALQWDVAENILPLIGQRSRGTPRLALRLLQACRRVARSNGEDTIGPSHLARACQLEQIDHLGLGPVDQQYLAILAEGASRLNIIASRLGLPPRTISHVTEPVLQRLGLVVKDDHCLRHLTTTGRMHLSKSRSIAV
jgi:holliday junction DNA helicase RuvB